MKNLIEFSVRTTKSYSPVSGAMTAPCHWIENSLGSNLSGTGPLTPKSNFTTGSTRSITRSLRRIRLDLKYSALNPWTLPSQEAWSRKLPIKSATALRYWRTVSLESSTRGGLFLARAVFE
jgi:hypothetical protein